MPAATVNNCEKRKIMSRAQAVPPEDDICIAGISGVFPKCNDINELEHNLYNKIDMVDDSSTRWPHYSPEIPKRMGNIGALDKFDAQFFGVHYKQAHSMDPQGRILIEKAYEAIMDAGVNPKSLRGTRTGVFIGACFAEAEKTWFYDRATEGGFGITGCSRAMLANRISYTLGLLGQSFLIDTACSSSMYALDAAFTAMRSGECDAAIVGGANLLMHPLITLQFARLGVLAQDGYCRPFDNSATGYVRSEAICSIFLQKARDAKRIYAKVLYSKTNCDGHKLEGITYPAGRIQQRLLSEFYDDIQIDPSSLAYMEAHSTGTVVGDPEECIALDNIFCKNRKSPLLVGSIKSNVGHSESSSGLCSIAKVILAFERGEVAPNINFESNRKGIKALEEGRLKVCTEVTKLKGDLVGINSFGFGGANAHALLVRTSKTKINNGAPVDSLPRLVTWSGRTEAGVERALDSLSDRPLDVEHVALLHNIQSKEEPGFLYRGFGIFTHNPEGNAICANKSIQRFTGIKRPVVFMYSGMGSQWNGMGGSLMEIPICKDSIMKCQKCLRPYGMNVIDIITSQDPAIFENTVNSFVGIMAIQIALTDLLHAMNVEADYLIGHSTGENCCSYADGATTLEETILLAFYRGLSSQECTILKGSMAAVGIGYKKIIGMLPPGIELACHNSAESSTISGPAALVSDFVTKLKAQGILAKEVNSSNIPYHSKYIAPIGEKLKRYLSRVLTKPKKRSDKWLSTSVPKNRWHLPENQYVTANYFVNNLLNPVLFEETAALLPDNAIIIEIAPHGLLQAIVKKSIPDAIHVPLTQRGHPSVHTFVLSAIGKLFMNGLTMSIDKIYPPVEFPVSRNTPRISPLMAWDHSEEWYVTKFGAQKSQSTGERKVKISVNMDDYVYVTGHQIDGRCLFPATGYLELVWVTLAKMKGPIHHFVDVEFEDIRFLRATALTPGQEIELTIMIHYGTGNFEVSEGNTSIVTGTIRELLHPEPLTDLPPIERTDYPMMKSDDFYKELRIRGYQYGGLFKSVSECRADGLCGKIKWNMNWVAFMDCILQMQILRRDSRSLLLPTRIQKLRINSKDHMARAGKMSEEDSYFDVKMSPELGIIQAGGIEVVGMVASAVSRRKAHGHLVLESYKFLPYINMKVSKDDALRVCTQLAIENSHTLKVRAVELRCKENTPIIGLLNDVLQEIPSISIDLKLLSDEGNNFEGVPVENVSLSTMAGCTFVIVTEFLKNQHHFDDVMKCIQDGGYLISRESLSETDLETPSTFNVLASILTEDEQLVLLEPIKRKIFGSPKIVNITNTQFEWVTGVRQAAKDNSVILVGQNEPTSGLIGFINCLRKEPDYKNVKGFFVDDDRAPPFSLENPFYTKQLMFGLAINVYRNGQWGSYRHVKLRQQEEEIPRNKHFYVNTLHNGDLSSLSWLGGPLKSSGKNIVNIQYSSINFRDVMLATARLSVEIFNLSRFHSECVLGLEYSGVDKKGLRVMGMSAFGAMATQIEAVDNLTWIVPNTMTLRQAATIPVVYVTVYCAFFLHNPISSGKSVLIHAGSGGVGLAAIRIALAYHMEVYTTVSNEAKKKFLLEQFPALKESNIGNSRDCSFERMIKIQTKGKGVDYVLNSLSDDKLHASIRCLGRAGTFLEIGKFDLSNDTKIGLGNFLKEMSFRSVLADNLFLATPAERKRIHDLINKDLKTGIIRPLPSTVFGVNEIEKAYRYLSTGKHVGKVMVKIRKDPHDELTFPIRALPRAYFNSQKVYVIPGGLGGFGMELVDWMILRGARKLVLSSSRGISNDYQKHRLRLWKGYGCHVIISTSDITTLSGCKALFKEAQQLGEVDGIFNLAVTLHDDIFDNQTVQTFTDGMSTKAEATGYLDTISRKVSPTMSYFVAFSSVSCGLGNAGQTVYGMANSVMERIVERRCADGLKGKAIQWGAVGEVGLVANMTGGQLDVEIAGTVQQRISSCLRELDALLTTGDPIVLSMVVAEKNTGKSAKTNIVDSVLNVMGIRDIKSISMGTSLSELGMDSLMAVEIRQTLEREFGLILTTQNLRSLTFLKLQEYSDESARDTDNLCGQNKSRDDDKILDFNYFMEMLSKDYSPKKLFSRISSKNSDEQFDSCVAVFPGVEGETASWSKIASGLNIPVFMISYDDQTKSNMELISTIEKVRYFREVNDQLLPALTLKISFSGSD
ncbi:fatty acid synthase-like isoform X2 [Bradysia coprophila]|uniref:fatty acid synthase-like isoform X2 n=1 Tax=Bradysia coprophila TaxID=38358 RepID=UPI00187DAB5B|nr:fatty acid synthase-like isoform X2 [Bradysia coprophila]